MGRLTRRINGEVILNECGNVECRSVCDEMSEYKQPCDVCPINEAFKKLAHYEDLEEVLRTTLTEEAANAILSSPHDFKEWIERGQFYVRKIEEQAVDFGYLSDWYISSVDEYDEPVWTEKHIRELIGDFILIPRNEKSEVL